MKSDFQIAHLNEEEKQKLEAMEKELDMVLIAWEKDSYENHKNS